MTRAGEMASEDRDRPLAAKAVSGPEQDQYVSAPTHKAAADAGPHLPSQRATTDYPRDATVAQLLERQAALTPSKSALRFHGRSTTYRELHELANRMAHALRKRGIGRGSLVGLCLERSVEMVAAVLAVHKAGAAYIPLDPAFPSDRLAFMIDDSGLALVVSSSGLSSRHGCVQERLLELDVAAQEIAGESPDPLGTDARSALPMDPAYVLYTSGSTGKPKGVQVHHRAAVNFLTSMRQEPGLSPEDRLLAVTTLSFDISVLELLLPLSVGAEIVLATRDEAMDGIALRNLLESASISFMQATPVTWRLLVESGWQGSQTFKALCGGEALPVDLAEALVTRVGELWNMYGPTETTVWSTCCRITEPRRGIHIGRPIANTSVWVLGPELQPCAQGDEGELYIGGDGVALGYLNRPELTAERFIRDPFSADGGARLYRTGDLARFRPDGNLECLGRTDHQVKIRGFRIELGEIENALLSHPSVRDAVVHAKRVNSGEAQLLGYVILADAGTELPDDLSEHLTRTLPHYMVPSAFVILDELPRTPNGKVDRNALPGPEAAVVARAPKGAAPSNDVESKIAAIYASRLKLPTIGVHDSFFAAGGDSLGAVAVIRELNEAFGLELAVGAILENPTVAGLARLVERGGGRLKSVVVSLHQGGQLPLFFVCGITLYAPMARNLAGACSSYGVYVPEEDAFFEQFNDPGCISLEQLAGAYASAIRTQAPQGPYAIAGVSFGGLIAFEVARQLRAEGHEVRSLVLLDAILPGALRRKWREWLLANATDLSWNHLQTGLARLRELRESRPRAANPVDKNQLIWRALKGSTTHAYLEAAPTYDGSTLIIRARDRDGVKPGWHLDLDLGWSRFLRGPTVVADAPGGHLGILESPRTAKLVAWHLQSEGGTL